ncbi:MAG: cation diffusion facilitator family transporter [Ignavibacteria bacterium]|nr:cation diffusion facilitator family transporter [Ignavibacteria bacterium]MBT8392850.1 cation diffusion facilitator family transporter [Ignavibacteria bacterium]NNJ54066.1 cation transporter [Ignavibacteriaceae bacterium]NNL20649.1 cation transporter [Ignavibacteriaceae bacterium]
MNQTNQISLRKKAAYISLFVGIGMLILKVGAYLITGSVAIFSDAAESVVHIAATSMALYSIILSAKPADESHPYGHGNIEYFSAGFEGFLIVLAAGVIIYEAVSDLIAGPELRSLSVGVLFIGAAGFVNLALGLYLIRTGKTTDSLTLKADGKHVLTDAVTSIGVVVGIILVILTDYTFLDPIVAILVALNIVFTGYRLVRESIGGLMLESDPVVLQKLSDLLISIKEENWIDLHELRYWKSGDRTFIDFHLILPYYFTIEESHKEEKRIDEKLERVFPNSQIKIHFDFCNFDLCKYCNYQKCEVRKEEKKINFDWNIEKLVGNAVYKNSI